MTSVNQINSSYNVLLIEEDPQQTDLYSSLIREVAQCKVDVMSRIENSVEWVARSNYALVVIDIGKKSGSSMGGLSLLEQIKRMSPMTSVILISEKATVEQAVAAIRLGAEDYFKKPFNLENFQLALRRGLDRKKVFGENAGASSFLNLLNSCQMISATMEQKKIFEIVQSYLAGELKSRHAAFYQSKDGEPLRVATSQAPDTALEEILDIALHASGVLPKMLESNEYYLFVERGQLTPALFVFRFKCADEGDYFAVCLSPVRPANIGAFESRLRLLKSQIEVTGKNIKHYRGVEHLVYVDDATGLYNTRYLNYILDREIAQSESTQKPFAILFIDADRFKQVNEKHGHLVGTKLLNELGSHLKRFVLDTDTVFRYGGDEFVAILSASDLSGAQMVAERIRQSIEAHVFLEEEGLNLHFTVSIGVALFPEHANSKAAVIQAADDAMFSAKRISRNQVTIASPRVAPAASATAETAAVIAVVPDPKESSGASGASGG